MDIAFFSDEKYDDKTVFISGNELSCLINIDVDLINLKKAATVLQIQIISKGNLIYCNDENKLNLFKIRVLKEYALLNEERDIIIKKIIKRGKVYAE